MNYRVSWNNFRAGHKDKDFTNLYRAIKFVKKLEESENNHVFGVIEWDQNSDLNGTGGYGWKNG